MLAMLSSETCSTIAAAAGEAGIDPVALEAVVTVESGGRVFALIGGREEPLIRWEGHYFDRLCKPSVRSEARAAGLAAPEAGAIANPPTQAARWKLLRQAARLDHDAAYQSVSWGVGQVMGAHWQALNYASVDALVADARSGLAGQLKLMLRFLHHVGLVQALNDHDWPRFARGYNGPAYRRNGYDTKLSEAFAALQDRDEGSDADILRPGSAGEAVCRLQQALKAAGETVAVDGRFGRQTESAVCAFQEGHGLRADGLVGPRTRAALRAFRNPPDRSRLAKVLGLGRNLVRLGVAIARG